MLAQLLFIVSFCLIALLAAAAMVGVVHLWKHWERRKRRESPLTKSLLRLPGHALSEQLVEIEGKMLALICTAIFMPLIVAIQHLIASHFGGESESVSRALGSVGMVFVSWAFIGWRLTISFHHRKRVSLGLEGERFTAEALNQLVRDGFWVYHDIPFPYGNIDHVVISPYGVFSINTKVLCKPIEGEGRANVVIDYHQNQICFPDRSMTIPTAQLEGESRWLSKHLESSVGHPICVEPLLSLPGWYISNRIGTGTPRVFNPLSPQAFFKKGPQALSAQLMQQISHQLEVLCRDQAPSFRERKEWK